MKELKMGDTVEIKVKGSDFWEDRIFLKRGIDSSIICVSTDTENRFNAGYTFDVARWSTLEWRIKQEPEIIPFTFKDAEDIIGKTVKFTINGEIYLITGAFNIGVAVGHEGYSFNELLHNYTFLDGSPCGKVKGE